MMVAKKTQVPVFIEKIRQIVNTKTNQVLFEGHEILPTLNSPIPDTQLPDFSFGKFKQ